MQPTPNAVTDGSLTVVVLESLWATIYLCDIDSDGAVEVTARTTWDPSTFLSDPTGARLLEEVIRRVRACWTKNRARPSGVALTLPGTLEGVSTVVSSSRLGIRQQVPVSEILANGLGVPCRVFHDVECLALGESMHALSTEGAGDGEATLVYVFVDEGIGSKTLIRGTPYVGAGVAGVLGRLTVQPDGSYYRALAARGPLEVFASRPWVSENLVALYTSEQAKRDTAHDALSNALANTKFRKALRVAATSGEWRGLDYDHIADGLNHYDPIAISVLDVAARYMGFAINAIITILNPHQIMLAGAMMTNLPGFADRVINHARGYSWALAWNRTHLAVSTLGREAQVYGAANRWAYHAARTSR